MFIQTVDIFRELQTRGIGIHCTILHSKLRIYSVYTFYPSFICSGMIFNTVQDTTIYYSVYLFILSLFTAKYKSSQQIVCRGLSIMQSYITNYKSSRLFVTVYRCYSHILQIIATDCSSRFIDYTVIYYKSSRQTVRHGLSIMQSYITNYRHRLFVMVYRLCSHILQIIAADYLSRFINYAVIYYKSSQQTVRHDLSIM